MNAEKQGARFLQAARHTLRGEGSHFAAVALREIDHVLAACPHALETDADALEAIAAAVLEHHTQPSEQG